MTNNIPPNNESNIDLNSQINNQNIVNSTIQNSQSNTPIENINTTVPPLPVEAVVVDRNSVNEPIHTPVNSEEEVSIDLDATKDELKLKKKKPNRAMFVVVGLLGFILLLAVSAIFFLLSSGQGSSLLQGLGIESANMSGLLYAVIGFVSAGLSLAGLGLGMFGIFKRMNTPKEAKKERGKFMKFLLAGVLSLILGLTGVLLAFNRIGYIEPIVENTAAIITTPVITTDLTAPVEIIFNVGDLGIDENQYNIVSYTWSFGDGETATGPMVVHTYTSKPSKGFYEAVLKVHYQEIGNFQAEIEEAEFKQIIGISNEQVVATFSFTPETGQVPIEIMFDASESRDPDGYITKYEWDFDEDGITDAEGVKVAHTFTTPGSHIVKLTITDNNGEKTIEEATVALKDDSVITPIVKNTPTDTVLIPSRAYQFDASESISLEGEIVLYEWDFGDGTQIKGRKVTHSFKEEGIYEVSVTLTDDADNTTTYFKNYTVNESGSPLFARFTTQPEFNEKNIITGSIPLKVSFNAGSSSGEGLVDYEWDFDGDGTIDANGQTAEYTYTESGDYTATLTIRSIDDEVAKTSIKVSITESEFKANMTANPITGMAPLTVNFDATSTRLPSNENITAFRWDFGDGSPLLTHGPTVSHKYITPGEYTASVTAITTTNKHSTAEVNLIVTAIPLKACFTMSRKIGPAPLIIEFNPKCSTGSVNRYLWNFGGQKQSTERTPTFTFDEPGTFDVTLEVSDSNNNISTFTSDVTVE